MAEQADTKAEEEETPEVIQPSFKLSYFSFAGRAACIRLAAIVGNVSFSDEFVTKDEHAAAKRGGLRRWSGLPELTVYGSDNKALITFGQSNAILRYIGKVASPPLYPTNPLMAALCDEVLDSCEDVKKDLIGAMATSEQRQQLIGKDGKLTLWLTGFEKRLQENDKRNQSKTAANDDEEEDEGYIVGDGMTIADLKLFELLHGLWLIFQSYDDIPKDLITRYPAIQKHYQLLMGNETVTEFLQKFSLRNSEFTMDPTDEDIKTQTFPGDFKPASL